MAVYDVIVIGAGVEGSSCAYNLAKAGKKVLMLEQFPLPHSRGSSHGQSRITRYAYDDEFYVKMMVDAFPMWAELEKEAGEVLFVNCGVLDIRPNAEEAKSVTSALSTHGIPHELLTARQVAKRFPAFAIKEGEEAVFDPSGGLLRADRALAAFQRVFKELGGTIRDDEAVLNVQPGSTVKVSTSRGLYAGSSLVVAVGPWAKQFLPSLGLHLHLKPIRVSPMYWRIKEGEEDKHTFKRLPCFIDTRGDKNSPFHYYGLPATEYPGLVKVAHHDGPAANPNTRDIIDEDDSWVEREVTQAVKSCLPGLVPTPAITERCMYTMTPDSHPYIDRHPKFPNIIIAAGFSGHGFKLAPAVGKAVRELISGEKLSYNMKPFSISRFDAKANL